MHLGMREESGREIEMEKGGRVLARLNSKGGELREDVNKGITSRLERYSGTL
jgi:hypothetical protein